MTDFDSILTAETPSVLAATHSDLAARAGADESFYIHRTGGTWQCERWSPQGVETFAVAESDLGPAPDQGGLTARALSPDHALARMLASRGINAALSLELVLPRHAWRWCLGRRTREPFREQEVAAARDRFSQLGPLLALRDALQDGDSSREQLELILNHSTDAIILVDAQNRIRLFNAAATEIFGYAPSEVSGMSYDVLLAPEMRDKGEAERIRQLVEQGAATQEQECLRWSKDGKPLALKVRWAPIQNPHGTLVSRFSFIRDLRPVKRLREELVRVQSLALIGELAASVAHEVRNPLASIMAAIETLRSELPPAGTQQETIRRILDEIRRLDGTVERLLIFAKPWEVCPRDYDLAAVVRGIAATMSREPAAQKVACEVSCPPTCPVTGDPQLVEHVLANVLRNAAEAMPAGGRIDLKLSAGDSTVEILVRDTGPGIASEHQDRIFRPFFTTKTRGTGLGLATCQKMVQAHKGTIKIRNAAGGPGAEVLIRLPRTYR